MPILNWKARKSARKQTEMSDVQKTVQEHQNGVEKTAPNLAEPTPQAPGQNPLEPATLRERHKDMTQGVNSLRAEKEQLEKRLAEINEGILRTEGALVMLGAIINEMEPQREPSGRGG